MAALDRGAGWTAAQTRAQFSAVLWLRWRILLNGFRRKGGVGNLVGQIVAAPFVLALLIGPSIGAAFAGYLAFTRGQFALIQAGLWAIFGLSQLANLQFGQPNTTFQPTQLIRFPVGFRSYSAIRTFFGLISPANLTTLSMCLGASLGMCIASPAAIPGILLAMFAFVLANVFFTRMLFIWVERWLATRRTREILTAVILIGSLGIQWANVTFNPGFHHSRAERAANAARLHHAQALYSGAQPYLGVLPPGLTARALADAQGGRFAAALLPVCVVLLFAAAFFAVFAWRLHLEFRGETLSEVAGANAARKAALTAASVTRSPTQSAPAETRPGGTAVGILFAKEFLAMRRNTGIFYGLIAPLAMVLLFAGRIAPRAQPGMLLAGAVAYVMLGFAPMNYNTFGTEGAGVQFYSFAPLRMRDVMIAKNLLNALLAALEIVAVFIAIVWQRHMPAGPMTLAVLLWAVFTILLSMAMGNRRSITSPKRIDPQKPAGKQTPALSALLAIGLMLVAAALGEAVYLLALYLDNSWVLVTGALVLVLLGAGLYFWSLQSLERLFDRNRDGLMEILAKAG